MNNYQNKILKEKKYNSSIVSAGLAIGVHPRVIELYLPEMLQATKIINEQKKNQTNRESIQDDIK